MPMPLTPKKSDGIGKSFGQVGSIGLVLAACIFIGTAIGVWLDRWLHTQPWLMLLFLLLGIVAGFYNVMKMLPGRGRDSQK
jgi:ATP synthase protein I